MTEPVESLIKRGITKKSVIFSVLYGVVLITGLTYGFFYGDWNPVAPGGAAAIVTEWPAGVLYPVESHAHLFFAVLGAFFLPMIVSALLPSKYKFSMSEFAFIYATIAPIVVFNAGGARMVFSIPWRMFTNRGINQYSLKYVPAIMPGKDLTEANKILTMAAAGKQVTPWEAWISCISLYMFLYISLYVFMSFGMALLSRIWVDNESLAFPCAQAITYLAKGSSKDGEYSLIKNRFLWVGFAVGFIPALYQFVTEVFMGVPLNRFQWGLDLTGLFSSLPVGILAINLKPWYFGFALLWPKDVLFTAILAYIIYDWIVPLILVQQGLLDPKYARHENAYWRMYSAYGTIWEQAGYEFVFNGLVLGVGIYPLIRHRKVLASMIRSALRKSTAGYEGALYRKLWIGWLLGGAGLLIGITVLGMPVYLALVAVAYIGVMWMCQSRIVAETGGSFGSLAGGGQISSMWLNIFMVDAVFPFREFRYPFQSFVHGIIVPWPAHGSYINSAIYNMDSFKVAKETRTKWSDLIPGQLVATIIAVGIAVPLFFVLVYSLGYTGRYITGPHYLTTQNELWGTFGNIKCGRGAAEYATCLVSGFIIAILLSVLRARISLFTWISPAVLAAPWFVDWLIPSIACLIVQRITLRIGGTSLYQEKVIPIAIGLLLSLAPLWVIGVVSLTLKGVTIAM